MRVRLATLLALILVAVPVTTILGATAAGAGTGGRVVLAQEGDETEEPEGGETPAGEAERDADSEVGADEEEEAPAVEEEGPVWTYQMAWIVIGMLIFMFVGVALAYKKLVADRQRAGV